MAIHFVDAVCIPIQLTLDVTVTLDFPVQISVTLIDFRCCSRYLLLFSSPGIRISHCGVCVKTERTGKHSSLCDKSGLAQSGLTRSDLECEGLGSRVNAGEVWG